VNGSALMKISQRIADLINWCVAHIHVDETEKRAAGWVRIATKSILDLLRNLLVVGIFQFFAEKTKSPMLWLRFVLYMAVNLIVIGALWLVISLGIGVSINELTKAQGR
jgi:hypothetical protein